MVVDIAAVAEGIQSAEGFGQGAGDGEGIAPIILLLNMPLSIIVRGLCFS